MSDTTDDEFWDKVFTDTVQALIRRGNSAEFAMREADEAATLAVETRKARRKAAEGAKSAKVEERWNNSDRDTCHWVIRGDKVFISYPDGNEVIDPWTPNELRDAVNTFRCDANGKRLKPAQ